MLEGRRRNNSRDAEIWGVGRISYCLQQKAAYQLNPERSIPGSGYRVANTKSGLTEVT